MANAILNAPEKAEKFFAEKLDFIMDPMTVNQQIKSRANVMVIDVRAAKDFIKGHVPGAINLPEGQWDIVSGWPNDWSLIIYCYSPTCHLADHAAIKFALQLHTVLEKEGALETCKKNKLHFED